ncbi:MULTISPECIES: cardiolipin synthase [Clostridium]|uniref:Cardiolipin synthase n=1 Tax=Clostridium senegalense TaxID=1465809 RepID=A0A6M0H092_9CLOT|nr:MULTISPECIES: cardiolipin synthase [Clostridium]NEU03999.1 cardiolipin synthase [Clostridium senegalense]
MSFVAIFKNIITFIYIINIFLAILLIIFEKRNPNSTWTWIMIMFFIPILGFILYLFLGQDLRKQKFFHYKKEEEEVLIPTIQAQHTMLKNDYLVKNNHFLNEYRDFIQLNLTTDNAIFTHNNDVKILNNGEEKFPKLITSLKNAKNFIHIQYYIFRDDDIGNEIINILTEKAKSGVEVKVLYDGMGCIWLPKKFFTPIIESGGEVVCFFPPFIPYINLRLNYRNHRKICVIDGIEGFIGGLNIGDEYLGKDENIGFWRDIHLYIIGDAVATLETRFLLDWRFASNKEDFSMSKNYFPKNQYIGNKPIQIISSGPDSQWGAIRNSYLKMISRAEKNIYIETPYLIPDDSILTALKLAALSGIDVKIIIPCKPDHMFVYWATKSYAWELMEAGVHCYTYNNGFIHSKIIAIDSKLCTVGTANLDMRSFKLNFEVNAMIYDEDSTKDLERIFLKDIENSTYLTNKHYAERSLIIKVKEAISRLLAPML